MPSKLRRSRLTCETLESREVPSIEWIVEPFDTPTALPNNWQQWGNVDGTKFEVQEDAAETGIAGLVSLAPSRGTARAWIDEAIDANASVAVSIRGDGAAPVAILARGSNLASAKPSFLFASVGKGGHLDVREVIDGSTRQFTNIRPIDAAPTDTWFRVELHPNGMQMSVRVIRGDTGAYLTSAGLWSAVPTEAVKRRIKLAPEEGLIGVARNGLTGGAAAIDNFAYTVETENRDAVNLVETFDTTALNALPVGWGSWKSDSTGTLGVASGRSVSGANGLLAGGSSRTIVRTWHPESQAANVQVSAAIYADTLSPAQVFLRASNLDTATPTYYAASLIRGMEIKLLKVANGVETTLGTVKSTNYVSGKWVRLSLFADGSTIRAGLLRTDTNQWLASDGSWTAMPDFAVTVTDTSIAESGFAGVARSAGTSSSVVFDDFTVKPATSNGPQMSVTANQSLSAVSDDVTFTATAPNGYTVTRVEFRINGKAVSSSTIIPAEYTFDSTLLNNGSHTLTVLAADTDGNVGTTSVVFTVANSQSSPLPSVPDLDKKFTHIRIAQLAYSGTPIGEFELDKLKNAVDLVIPNTAFMGTIDAANPSLPQMLYTNVSNLYLDVLRDWLDYADANNTNRELAFFHVSEATPWQGNSPSSIPVTWFWYASRGRADGTAVTNVTGAARGTQSGGVAFGSVDEAITLGYTERYREINVALSKTATGSYAGVWEYAAAVDANGTVTQWKTLPTLSDSTNQLRQSGKVLFDPQADWVAGKTAGTNQRLYSVRFRTTVGTIIEAPVAQTLHGRDYVAANGGTKGTIPSFDASADQNGDGYLTDAEYATRRAGADARFRYESRLFYPYYGQQRFVVNPSSSAIKKWAADYHQRLLASTPLADGLFIDNSHGKLPFAGINVLEGTQTYTADSANLVGAVWRAVNPKLVVANTVGSITEANLIAGQSAAVLEEFLLRPSEASWSTVETVADIVRGRLAANGSPYVILDSYPGSSSVTDPRTQIGTLAYYYLFADPNRTMLMFYGGYQPNADWDLGWVDAAEYDVGQPSGERTIFARGADPQNLALEYRVYAREYDNALVLYKPKSYFQGTTGTTADATATTHHLGGSYRTLNADGTQGPIISQITLRGGEGAVLVKA
jgi:hypothetical protein